MKTQTRALVVVVASIAILTAATLGIGAQKAQFDPPVFTIKSKGKAVAIVTLLQGGSELQVIAAGTSRFSGPSEDLLTGGTFTGKLTLQRNGDAQPLIVINADEIEMIRKQVK